MGSMDFMDSMESMESMDSMESIESMESMGSMESMNSDPFTKRVSNHMRFLSGSCSRFQTPIRHFKIFV